MWAVFAPLDSYRLSFDSVRKFGASDSFCRGLEKSHTELHNTIELNIVYFTEDKEELSNEDITETFGHYIQLSVHITQVSPCLR